jgi:long-subunit fatty acid transport protein
MGAGAASVYNQILIGERLEAGDVRSITLGGSTQLIPDSLGVLQLNPAMLALIDRVTIGMNLFVGVDKGSSEEYSERDVSSGFGAFRAAFMLPRGLVFSLGYRARYDPDGTFSTTETTDSGDAFTTTYSKSGGLFSLPLSLSFDLSRFLSFGFTYSFESGFVEERWDRIFEDPTIAPGAGIRKEEVSGNGFGGGVVLHLTKGFMVGANYESEIDYDTEVRDRFTQESLDTSYVSTMRLPAQASAGVTWVVSESFLIAGSYAYSDFSEFVGLNFPSERLGPETSLAVGLEFTKGISLRGARLPVRLGFNYQEYPYEHPEGETLNKWLFSIGTGLKIRGGKGKMDLALQFGQTGSIDPNLIEDRLVRIYVGLSGSEKWSRKGADEF